tara:strand:+ start:98 stop:685 length:588 start_codon:yes stop_codon:yes gene_type:complete
MQCGSTRLFRSVNIPRYIEYYNTITELNPIYLLLHDRISAFLFFLFYKEWGKAYAVLVKMSKLEKQNLFLPVMLFRLKLFSNGQGTNLLNEYSGKNSTRDSKIQTDFQLMFFRRPIEILPHRHDKNKIGYLKLEKMRLSDNGSVIGTGEYDTIKCDLLISSIGYKANTLTGLPNITKGNYIPNNRGGRFLKNHPM